MTQMARSLHGWPGKLAIEELLTSGQLVRTVAGQLGPRSSALAMAEFALVPRSSFL